MQTRHLMEGGHSRPRTFGTHEGRSKPCQRLSALFTRYLNNPMQGKLFVTHSIPCMSDKLTNMFCCAREVLKIENVSIKRP